MGPPPEAAFGNPSVILAPHHSMLLLALCCTFRGNDPSQRSLLLLMATLCCVLDSTFQSFASQLHVLRCLICRRLLHCAAGACDLWVSCPVARRKAMKCQSIPPLLWKVLVWAPEFTCWPTANVGLAGSGSGHGGPVGCRLRSLARRFAGAFF